jgi:hypothetical protein
LTSDEEYADLAEMTLALGIPALLRQRYGQAKSEEVTPLF